MDMKQMTEEIKKLIMEKGTIKKVEEIVGPSKCEHAKSDDSSAAATGWFVKQMAEAMGAKLTVAKKEKEIAGTSKDEHGKSDDSHIKWFMKQLDDAMERNLKEEKEGKTKKDDEIEEIETEQIDGCEWVKYHWVAYNLMATYSPNLTAYQGGRISKDSGKNDEFDSIRNCMPIPAFNSTIKKPTIVFYYDAETLRYFPNPNDIGFGFCDAQFQLEGKMLGKEENSIGIWNTEGIWVDGIFIDFENAIEGVAHFLLGIIGIGIVYQPNSSIKCFATCNGKFLGMVELPAKFANFKLFPAASLRIKSYSFRTIYEKEKWQFKEFGRALE